MRLEPKMGQACSHTWFISWARREPREREGEKRKERCISILYLRELAGREMSCHQTPFNLEIWGREEIILRFSFFYGEYTRTDMSRGSLHSFQCIAEHIEKKKNKKLKDIKRTKQNIFDIFSCTWGTVILYLSILYQMYLWFLCIFISYKKKYHTAK